MNKEKLIKFLKRRIYLRQEEYIKFEDFRDLGAEEELHDLINIIEEGFFDDN